MYEIVKKLLTIKSLVTLIATIVFSYLAITGVISPEQVMLVYTTIIAFYFGTQTEKRNAVVETQATTPKK